MGRIRSIRPDIWDDAELISCSPCARLLFVGLITLADDDGRALAMPGWLRSKIYPLDSEVSDSDVEGWLAELHAAELCHVYEVRGKPYVALESWDRNQKIDKRWRQKSKLPPPPGEGRRPWPPARETEAEQVADQSASGDHAEATSSARGDHAEATSSARGDLDAGEDRIGVQSLRTERVGDRRSPTPASAKKTKQSGKGEDGGPTGGKLSHLLADLIAKNDPDGKRPEVGKTWLAAERLLIERDGRDPEQAERLIEWCQRSEFWYSNILSMPKFREQYRKLYGQATRDSDGEKKAPKASVYDKNTEEVAA